MALCVFGLIASEFMSASLLSHRAQQQGMGLR
jgi:predicted MFS family arabinose efflux permease